jgi:hypothetical protein
MIEGNSILSEVGHFFSLQLVHGWGWGIVDDKNTESRDFSFPDRLVFQLDGIHAQGKEVGILYGRLIHDDAFNGFPLITLVARFDEELPFNHNGATYHLVISDIRPEISTEYNPPHARCLVVKSYPFIYGFGSKLATINNTVAPS